MRFPARAFASLLLLPLFATAGCGDDSIEGAESDLREYSPYPADLREMRVLQPIDPQNSTIDNGSFVRDQSMIASCASFGFIGLIENRLSVERGVNVDLAERYTLYSNFMSSGTLGDMPEIIARFPSIADTYGLMGEASYPYAEILENAARFG